MRNGASNACHPDSTGCVEKNTVLTVARTHTVHHHGSQRGGPDRVVPSQLSFVGRYGAKRFTTGTNHDPAYHRELTGNGWGQIR